MGGKDHLPPPPPPLRPPRGDGSPSAAATPQTGQPVRCDAAAPARRCAGSVPPKKKIRRRWRKLSPVRAWGRGVGCVCKMPVRCTRCPMPWLWLAGVVCLELVGSWDALHVMSAGPCVRRKPPQGRIAAQPRQHQVRYRLGGDSLMSYSFWNVSHTHSSTPEQGIAHAQHTSAANIQRPASSERHHMGLSLEH